MILHALKIVQIELQGHIVATYAPVGGEGDVLLRNLSEFSPGGGPVARDKLLLTSVNLKEDKALKNGPNYVRNEAKLTVNYENPPVLLNVMLLLTCSHANYENALLYLSRAIRFFQHKNVFTQDTVSLATLNAAKPSNPLDEMETFKLIFDLYSPSLEEVNHMWGTLGGKQYPFVMYTMRMLELKFKALPQEGPLITEVLSEFRHR